MFADWATSFGYFPKKPFVVAVGAVFLVLEI
jgi:hypothetical protein